MGEVVSNVPPELERYENLIERLGDRESQLAEARRILKLALHEMCHTSAPRNSFTDTVDAIDAFLSQHQQGESNG